MPGSRKSSPGNNFYNLAESNPSRADALDRATVERLLAEADELAAAFLNKPAIEGKPEYNHLDLRRGLLKQKALFALVSHSTTVPLVVQLLSPNIHLHSTTIICKRPETAHVPSFRRGWHRDIRMARDFGHENLPLAGIKVCYCLTDFSEPESGMTLMARGTHLRSEPLRIPKGAVDPVDVEVCVVRAAIQGSLVRGAHRRDGGVPGTRRRGGALLEGEEDAARRADVWGRRASVCVLRLRDASLRQRRHAGAGGSAGRAADDSRSRTVSTPCRPRG